MYWKNNIVHINVLRQILHISVSEQHILNEYFESNMFHLSVLRTTYLKCVYEMLNYFWAPISMEGSVSLMQVGYNPLIYLFTL